MPRSCSEVQSDINKIRQLKSKFDGLYDLADSVDFRQDRDMAIDVLKRIYELQNEINLYRDVLESNLFTSLEKAREIMGKNLIGPTEVKELYGYEFVEGETPVINFSRRRLERAKELGETLLLNVDTDNPEWSSDPRRQYVLSGRIEIGRLDHYSYESQTPRVGWSIIPPNDYLGEEKRDNIINLMADVVDYLKNKVYAGESLPVKYEMAIAEFNQQLPELKNLAEEKKTKEFLDIFLDLELVKKFIPTPVEILYANESLAKKLNKRFEYAYHFSSVRYLDKSVVMLDDFMGPTYAEIHADSDALYDHLKVMVSIRS